MNIGENIKKYRKERNLTQSQLGKLSNTPVITLGRYERGERVPTFDVLKNIADALDIELIDLISDDNNDIYIDFCGDSFDNTYKKLEILSADEGFMESILKKEKHEISFFEECLLKVYNSQEYDIEVYKEVFKLLASDKLQKKLNYSFNNLASNEIDLIRMTLNIMNSIKNDLRFINNSKK